MQIELLLKFLVHDGQLFYEKGIDILGVTFSRLFQGTFLDQEDAWVDAQIIIKNDDGTHFLERPDLLVDLGILVSEELAI